jgi:hypothetical protein
LERLLAELFSVRQAHKITCQALRPLHSYIVVIWFLGQLEGRERTPVFFALVVGNREAQLQRQQVKLPYGIVPLAL